MGETSYDESYYVRQVSGALRSARLVVPIVAKALAPASVVDFGCGQGAWLRAWSEHGVTEIMGIDGTYIDTRALQFPAASFRGADLTKPCQLGRRYGLAQSLEVAEHLPESSASTFIASIVCAAPMVMFSAAVRGQGGESHVNEQPLEYWRAHFARHDFVPFDFLRPSIRGVEDIEPWYRYNTLLYVQGDHVAALSESVRASAVPDGVPIAEGGSLSWRVRRLLVSALPRPAVNSISRALAKISAAQSRAGVDQSARDGLHR